MCICVWVCAHTQASVRGCVDGSWEADTVQENHPLATDLFSRWQFQSNSHPASQWLWPPNISITSSSTGLPQPVTQERREGNIHPSECTCTHTHTQPHAYNTHSSVLSFFYPLTSSPKHSTQACSGLSSTVPMSLGVCSGAVEEETRG